MAHVNGTIHNSNSTVDNLRRDLRIKELELAHVYELLQRAENELYNIPAAIKQHGYIMLSDHNGNHLVTLVEKVEVSDGK